MVVGIGFGAKLCMHLLRNMFRRGFARRRFRQWVWSRAKQRGVPKEGSVWSKALSKLRHGIGSKVNEVRGRAIEVRVEGIKKGFVTD